MSSDDFRPRIDESVHKRIRLCYFDENPSNYSLIYQQLAEMSFTEEGKKQLWFRRIEKLADEQGISVEEAMNNLIVSTLDSEGEFKAGARQIYARNNSVGE